MTKQIACDLNGWIPYKTYYQENELFCKWLFVGNTAFTEPFFEDTIQKCKSLPENSTLKHSISNIELLKDWSQSIDNIIPTAIIFHVSRCGSTLLSQLLGLDQKNIILAEVPIFDEILRWGFNQSMEDNILAYLQSAIAFYGAKRNINEQHLFIKTDSWHIHFYDLYRKLYPNIPFIFLYRNPEEVILSHQKKKGLHTVPGLIEAEIFGIDSTSLNFNDLDEYTALVLETYFAAMIEIYQKDSMAYFMNYSDGIMKVAEKIAQLTNIKAKAEWQIEMEKRLIYHSKDRSQIFEEKNSQLTFQSNTVERCKNLYHQLDRIRVSQQ